MESRLPRCRAGGRGLVLLPERGKMHADRSRRRPQGGGAAGDVDRDYDLRAARRRGWIDTESFHGTGDPGGRRLLTEES